MAWSEWKDGSGGTLQIVSIPNTVSGGRNNTLDIRTFDATSIPNYENLTIENFFVVPYTIGLTYASSSSGLEYDVDMKTAISYDATTGIVTVPKMQRYSSANTSLNVACISYNVYCAYVV